MGHRKRSCTTRAVLSLRPQRLYNARAVAENLPYLLGRLPTAAYADVRHEMEKIVATEKAKPEDKNTSDRQKALDTALAQIERQFGKGSVIKMSEKQAQVIEVIPTGSIALDMALGIGGLPRGRIIEI